MPLNNVITVGFIGLGQMGAGMAAMLAKAEVCPRVFDIDPSAISPVAALGGKNGVSIAQLVDCCQLIFICLPGEDEVEKTLFGQRGLLSLSGQLNTIVDTSTLDFSRVREFAKCAEKAGITYCDCPVSGLPKRARDGTLTMMFGGSTDVFDLVKPYLEIMGEQILHCGDVGSGQMMKAINNIIYNINIAGFCEVLPLAVKAGLDPANLEILLTGGSARSFASEHYVPRILDGRFDDDFPMQSAYKDIVNVQKIAASVQADMPLVDTMTAVYEKALASGFGRQPKSAMVKVYEHALGVKVRRP